MPSANHSCDGTTSVLPGEVSPKKRKTGQIKTLQNEPKTTEIAYKSTEYSGYMWHK